MRPPYIIMSGVKDCHKQFSGVTLTLSHDTCALHIGLNMVLTKHLEHSHYTIPSLAWRARVDTKCCYVTFQPKVWPWPLAEVTDSWIVLVYLVLVFSGFTSRQHRNMLFRTDSWYKWYTGDLEYILLSLRSCAYQTLPVSSHPIKRLYETLPKTTKDKRRTENEKNNSFRWIKTNGSVVGIRRWCYTRKFEIRTPCRRYTWSGTSFCTCITFIETRVKRCLWRQALVKLRTLERVT